MEVGKDMDGAKMNNRPNVVRKGDKSHCVHCPNRNPSQGCRESFCEYAQTIGSFWVCSCPCTKQGEYKDVG